MVTSFRHPKTPQGCHPPEAFRTMCSGEAQGLFKRQIIPTACTLLNFALAEFNLSEGKRWAHTQFGDPLLIMKCSTLFSVGNAANWTIVIREKVESKLLYSLLDWHRVLRWGAKASAWQSGDNKYVSAFTRHFPLRSTRSKFARKKSALSNNWDTSAMVKSQLYSFDVKQSGMVFVL